MTSFSFVSNFFLSSESISGFAASLALCVVSACASACDVSPSFFAAVSTCSLYHRAALGANKADLIGAGDSWDLIDGLWTNDLELERRALEDVERACLNIVRNGKLQKREIG